MQVDINNYQDVISKIGVQNLKSTEKEAHDLIVEGSDNFTNLADLSAMMDDPDIGWVINEHFKRVSSKIKSNENTNNRKSTSASSKRASKSGTRASGSDAGKRKRAKTSSKSKSTNGSKKASSSKRTSSRKSTTKKTTAKSKGTKKAAQKPPVVRTIKSPELVMLAKIKNIGNKTKANPKGEKTVRVLTNLVNDVEKQSKAGLFPKHGTLINGVTSAIKEQVKGMDMTEKVHIKISSETKKKIIAAEKTKTTAVQTNYMAGVGK